MPATKKVAARVPTDTEPIPVFADVETWQNETQGVVVINRVGEYGRRADDLIQGGRRFQVTPQERRMNQNAVNSADQDVFTNGTLRPLDLLEGDPDTKRLLANPNILDEDELPKIFVLKGEMFRQRIAEITNPSAIARLIELARDPGYEATLFQYECVKRRELELRGDLDEPKAKAVLAGNGAGPQAGADPKTSGELPRGVTPR
jgi:hypothetical protein